LIIKLKLIKTGLEIDIDRSI